MIEGNDEGNIMDITEEQLVCLNCVDCPSTAMIITDFFFEKCIIPKDFKASQNLGAILCNNASREPSCFKN